MRYCIRFILAYLLAISTTPLFAQAQGPGLDDKINDFLAPYTQQLLDFVLFPLNIGGVDMPIVILLLLLVATYFTFYFSFPNLRYFKLAIQVVRGQHEPEDNTPVSPIKAPTTDKLDTIQADHIQGEVTHFQALTTAISATVGLGNIAGVAIAIALGGPGATFWMIIAGLLGMSTKFVECTLGVLYRDIEPGGKVHGGPMYYLSKGLKELGLPRLGKFLGATFAVMCVAGSFGGGNMFQANQAAELFLSATNIQSGNGGFIFGVVLALLIGVVIIGGIKRIAAATEKIVPFMCGLYILSALVVLGAHFTEIPKAFALILTEAFSPSAAFGGFVGVLIMGFRRAAFSNEAGVGSAAIAHSAARTNYAASEGIVALLEPFIDTVVVCTMTALVIIITGAYIGQTGDIVGIELTSKAFDTVIPGYSYVLTVAVILFAFSSMLSWSYYGLTAWKFLFGKGKISDVVYKVLFCCFVVIGASAQLGAVVNFADAMVFAMVLPNIIGLVLLAPVVKRELNRYLEVIRN